VSVARGALGSQLYWAARGKRTDNRNNDLLSYESHYDCDASVNQNCNIPAYRWGFHFGHEHNRFDLICNSPSGDQGIADWIFTLGKWIDNGMPRDVPGSGSERRSVPPDGDIAITTPPQRSQMGPDGGTRATI
jgi:hypothetical protein